MKHATMVLITLLAIVALVGGPVSAGGGQPGPAAAYVEPGLLAVESGSLSIIVTADDSQTAARAVERLGGQVTSELWLIDAVAATLPASQLGDLAAYSGIQSIINNKGVAPANGPTCDPDQTYQHGPCASREGWVTDRREKKNNTQLTTAQKAPIVRLPDGGFVAIGDNGKVTFLNSDGSQRLQVTLAYTKGQTAPAIGGDGSIYFTGTAPLDSTKTIVFALNPDGSTRWTYTNKELVAGGVAVDANGYVYVAGTKAVIYVFNKVTGVKLWEIKPSTDKPGIVQVPPVVGADGTVYLLTSGVNPGFLDSKGNLFAIDPSLFPLITKDTKLSVKWRFVGELYVPLEYSPVLGNNGLIYLASAKKAKVYAVDAVTGALRFSLIPANKTTAQPLFGPDGALYLPSDKSLIGVNSNGSVRFAFSPDLSFESAPVFSADASTLYVGADVNLYALDTANGAVRWQVTMAGKIKASPALDDEGNIIVGSEGNDVAIISPAGAIVSRLHMSDKVVSSAFANLPNNGAMVLVGDKNLVTIGALPDQWDGRPDVEPADIKREWRLSNPVTIDIGADAVQAMSLANGTPINGQGVTVAVVDSGVYYNNKLRDVLGADLDQHFLGQADFVGDGTCTNGGTQLPGYCWAKKDKSIDGYGHGSHVAGIIWSQITDYATGVNMGVAPGANILSVRVLGPNGSGSYEDVIQGLQFVIANKAQYNVRIINLSLSADATVPYFVDPLNRAVEQAWANGIVVLAAAGNSGPGAETITVPGNDPYIITVGAINTNRTPGYWADDFVPTWSASGPTPDGFVKPDILAPGSNIVSFMYNDGRAPNDANNVSAGLVRQHPDYSRTTSLFRMNGTSMATGVASGVVALMLQAHPEWTPDQVKFRLMYTAQPALDDQGELAYSVLQQGAGRIWAPEAVLAGVPAGNANEGMDLNADLAHGWGHFDAAGNPVMDEAELAYHYAGPVYKVLSDDGSAYLYYMDGQDGDAIALATVSANDLLWLTPNEGLSWDSGRFIWSGGRMIWSGGRLIWSGGRLVWSGGRMIWSGGQMVLSGGRLIWSGGRMIWSGGRLIWSGTATNASGRMIWSGGRLIWSGGTASGTGVSSTTWIGDW